MKLILISDFHLALEKPVARTDKDFVQTQFLKLKFLLDFADREEAIILQAGDFFHTPRSWGMLPMIWDILKKYKTRIHVVFGQHDRYMYSKNTESTSLGILIKGGLVKEIPFEGMPLSDDVKVFGCGYGDWISKGGLPTPDPETPINILVIHREITDQRISKFQENWIRADEWVKYTKFGVTLCGDIHRKFSLAGETSNIFNSGPLVRRECSKDMLEHKPGFYLTELKNATSTTEWIEIPHYPANEIFNEFHIKSMKEKEEQKSLFEDFINAMNDKSIVKGVNFFDNLNTVLSEFKADENIREIISNAIEEEKS